MHTSFTSLRSVGLSALLGLSCAGAAMAAPVPHATMRLAEGQSCIPVWPVEALARGASGTTRMQLRVGPQGDVIHAKVISSSGSADLDESAMATAGVCKFDTRHKTGMSTVMFTHVWLRQNSSLAKTRTSARSSNAARLPCAPLAYPEAALRSGGQGTVYMTLLIGADGTVRDKKVARSSGFPELDQAALEGMANCKFTPAITEGVPEQSELSFSYTWTLK